MSHGCISSFERLCAGVNGEAERVRELKRADVFIGQGVVCVCVAPAPLVGVDELNHKVRVNHAVLVWQVAALVLTP